MTGFATPVARSAAALPLRTLAVVTAGAAAFLVGIAARFAQLHAGLLYPDGYQYLLMARGLAEHGSPTTRLGPAGDLFIPNADAAAKPLFPLLVAAADRVGNDPVTAARAITAVSAGAVLVLAGLLVWRLTRSWTGAAVTWLACLLSPTVGYWAGFAGPDPLAQALGLGAALAAASRKPALAGALSGLAVAARPELAVVAVGCITAALLTQGLRHAARSAALSGVATLFVVVAAVRPPLDSPGGSMLIAGTVAAAATTVALAAARRSAPVGFAACAVCVVLVAWSPAGAALVRTDVVLLACGLVGLAAAVLSGPLRGPAGTIAVSTAALAFVYSVKNPYSDRYLALLLPIAAIGAGLGITLLRGPQARVVGAALLACCLAVSAVAAPPRPDVGADAFAAIAPQLGDEPLLPLLTAAPDALGYLLPMRSVREMRAGEHGLVLLDGSQRLFTPGLSASGILVATFDQAQFTRPDGSIDHREIRLVRGVVVPRE